MSEIQRCDHSRYWTSASAPRGAWYVLSVTDTGDNFWRSWVTVKGSSQTEHFDFRSEQECREAAIRFCEIHNREAGLCQ